MNCRQKIINRKLINDYLPVNDFSRKGKKALMLKASFRF
jgi:hypothetical protein